MKKLMCLVVFATILPNAKAQQDQEFRIYGIICDTMKCHNPTKATVIHRGGTPPYHYTWVTKSGEKYPDSIEVYLRDTSDYKVTVTDNHGDTAFGSGQWNSVDYIPVNTCRILGIHGDTLCKNTKTQIFLETRDAVDKIYWRIGDYEEYQTNIVIPFTPTDTSDITVIANTTDMNGCKIHAEKIFKVYPPREVWLTDSVFCLGQKTKHFYEVCDTDNVTENGTLSINNIYSWTSESVRYSWDSLYFINTGTLPLTLYYTYNRCSIKKKYWVSILDTTCPLTSIPDTLYQDTLYTIRVSDTNDVMSMESSQIPAVFKDSCWEYCITWSDTGTHSLTYKGNCVDCQKTVYVKSLEPEPEPPVPPVDSTGIKLWQDVRIRIYPNPVRNSLTVETAGNGSVNVAICTPSGQLVKTFVANGTTTVNISGLSAGMYYIKTVSGKGTRVLRVLKE